NANPFLPAQQTTDAGILDGTGSDAASKGLKRWKPAEHPIYAMFTKNVVGSNMPLEVEQIIMEEMKEDVDQDGNPIGFITVTDELYKLLNHKNEGPLMEVIAGQGRKYAVEALYARAEATGEAVGYPYLFAELYSRGIESQPDLLDHLVNGSNEEAAEARPIHAGDWWDTVWPVADEDEGDPSGYGFDRESPEEQQRVSNAQEHVAKLKASFPGPDNAARLSMLLTMFSYRATVRHIFQRTFVDLHLGMAELMSNKNLLYKKFGSSGSWLTSYEYWEAAQPYTEAFEEGLDSEEKLKLLAIRGASGYQQSADAKRLLEFHASVSLEVTVTYNSRKKAHVVTLSGEEYSERAREAFHRLKKFSGEALASEAAQVEEAMAKDRLVAAQYVPGTPFVNEVEAQLCDLDKGLWWWGLHTVGSAGVVHWRAPMIMLNDFSTHYTLIQVWILRRLFAAAGADWPMRSSDPIKRLTKGLGLNDDEARRLEMRLYPAPPEVLQALFDKYAEYRKKNPNMPETLAAEDSAKKGKKGKGKGKANAADEEPAVKTITPVPALSWDAIGQKYPTDMDENAVKVLLTIPWPSNLRESTYFKKLLEITDKFDLDALWAKERRAAAQDASANLAETGSSSSPTKKRRRNDTPPSPDAAAAAADQRESDNDEVQVVVDADPPAKRQNQGSSKGKGTQRLHVSGPTPFLASSQAEEEHPGGSKRASRRPTRIEGDDDDADDEDETDQLNEDEEGAGRQSSQYQDAVDEKPLVFASQTYTIRSDDEQIPKVTAKIWGPDEHRIADGRVLLANAINSLARDSFDDDLKQSIKEAIFETYKTSQDYTLTHFVQDVELVKVGSVDKFHPDDLKRALEDHMWLARAPVMVKAENVEDIPAVAASANEEDDEDDDEDDEDNEEENEAVARDLVSPNKLSPMEEQLFDVIGIEAEDSDDEVDAQDAKHEGAPTKPRATKKPVGKARASAAGAAKETAVVTRKQGTRGKTSGTAPAKTVPRKGLVTFESRESREMRESQADLEALVNDIQDDEMAEAPSPARKTPRAATNAVAQAGRLSKDDEPFALSNVFGGLDPTYVALRDAAQAAQDAQERAKRPGPGGALAALADPEVAAKSAQDRLAAQQAAIAGSGDDEVEENGEGDEGEEGEDAMDVDVETVDDEPTLVVLPKKKKAPRAGDPDKSGWMDSANPEDIQRLGAAVDDADDELLNKNLPIQKKANAAMRKKNQEEQRQSDAALEAKLAAAKKAKAKKLATTGRRSRGPAVPDSEEEDDGVTTPPASTGGGIDMEALAANLRASQPTSSSRGDVPAASTRSRRGTAADTPGSPIPNGDNFFAVGLARERAKKAAEAKAAAEANAAAKEQEAATGEKASAKPANK
ncbi:hypothetical protein JCM10908_000396, partial [Rhodotorula pacifica]|uniref:uncharacterized protein n=1 Tax=Rhodotorula pacifica TaxID=1495444 RepID=UPI0031781201